MSNFLRTDHPLLDGLEGFWLPVHGLQGGSRLYDLSTHADHSDGQGLPYEVTFDDLYFKCADSSGSHTVGARGIRDVTEYSFLLVQYLNSSTQSQFNVLNNSTGFDAFNLRFSVFFDTNYPNSRSYRLSWSDSAGTKTLEPDTAYGIDPFSRNVLIGQVSQGKDTARLWRNGIKIGEVTGISGFGDPTGNSLEVGEALDTQYYIHALMLSSQWWTDDGVQALTDQARRGFPDLLNRRDQSALYVSTAGAVTLSTNELQHSHALEAPAVASNYSLSSDELKSAHTLASPTLSAIYSLTSDELQHTHTLDTAGLEAIYTLSSDELQHPHTVGSSSLAVSYALSTAELQHGHALESPTISISGLLTPEDLQHGHTLDLTSVVVQFALGTNDLQHSHTLASSQVDVAYALTPNGLQHLHTLDQTTLQVIFGLTPEDLQHAHRIETASGTPAYVVTPSALQHAHTLDDAVLGVIGFATQVSVSVRPFYDVETQEEELYSITLDASPILE